MTGFAAADVAVSGGEKGAFAASSASVYTLVVTPDGGGADLVVTVAAGAATDGTNTGPVAASSGTAAWEAVVVGSLAVPSSPVSVDEGGSASYAVSLGAEPSGTVAVAIAVSEGAGVEVSPSSLTFGPDDWSAGQTVTVRALEDDDLSDGSATLSHTASGGGYDGVTAEVSVSVTDDDEAALEVSESSLSLDEGGSASYAVSLGAEPSGTVAVAIAASGGAGVEVSPLRLMFGPDDWSAGQTVTVRALEDDDLSDGSATLSHTASGSGYDGVTAEVAVSVADDDEADATGASAAWMPRFGRVVSEQILEGVGDRVAARRRLDAPSPQGGARAGRGFSAMFAGQSPGGGSLASGHFDSDAGFDGALGASSAFAPEAGARAREDRSLAGMMRNALANSSFDTSGQTAGGSTWGLWGRGSVASLEGRSADGVSIEGDMTTGQIGADWSSGRWILGLSASHSKGEGDYAGAGGQGALESTMAALTPYFSVGTHRFSAWGALSAGRGDMTITLRQGAAVEADVEMETVAAGLHGELLNLGNGLSVSLLSDAMSVRTASEAAAGMPAADADASRVRAAVEASWTRPLAGGGQFSARLAGGARLDGGDADEGLGGEVSAGLSWMQNGLTFELEGRRVVAHEDDGFSQTGASVHLAWESGGAGGLGPSLSVRQHWGIATASGLEQLFAMRHMGQFGTEPDGRRLDTEIGWGLPLLGGRFAGTPFLLHGAQNSGSLQTLGWRMAPLDSGGGIMDVSLSLKLTRRAVAADGHPDRSVALEARMGF